MTIAQLRCTHCRSVPPAGTSVLIAQYGEVQEHICEACFTTEDANAPWDHLGQIDVLKDGSLRLHFPEEERGTHSG